MTKGKTDNVVRVKAVRAKDWQWWYVELTGVDGYIIAEGGYSHMYIGANYHMLNASSPRNLLRKLYRRLGVQKLDWEVWGDND